MRIKHTAGTAADELRCKNHGAVHAGISPQCTNGVYLSGIDKTSVSGMHSAALLSHRKLHLSAFQKEDFHLLMPVKGNAGADILPDISAIAFRIEHAPFNL